MAKKNKNKEGKTKFVEKMIKKIRQKKIRAKVQKKSQIRKVKITSSQKTVKKSRRGMTLRDIENKKKENSKIQNLISAIVLILGLFVGSLFVDVMQIVTKNGYSERSLRTADVFELGDKTWVAYKEPAIKVDILIADNEEECIACNADDILVWMKKFIPTMAINKVSESSEEGKKLIKNYELKSIPSFVFDKKIQEANFFQEDQVQEIFNQKDNKFVLNATALGIPVGKYLEIPTEKDGDIIIGNKSAQVKIITFFDFQCSYSKIFYEAAKQARNEFTGDQLALVYKNFPLDLQGQAISAALAGQCAYKQGRFEEMADLLFANQEKWIISKDFKIFDQYALQIGLNKIEFDECSSAETSRDLILESIEQGNQFGIAGTPASFVGEDFLNGIFQKEDIIEIVKVHLE